MVFRKQGRSVFVTWPTLPGFGRVGPWSTGLKSKQLAQSVENWLEEVAVTDPAVVRGILAGHFDLREAYVAHKERRLGALKERATDPLLLDVIRRYEPKVNDRRQLEGLEQLRRMAPKAARFSWLTVPKNITDLLADAVAEGQKVNSVYRSLYAAVKGVLTYEVGNARKKAITADVVFKYEDDSRDVTLTAEQVRSLLDACDEQIRPVVALAMLTGIDRAPLIRLTPAHIDFERGTIRVPDTKNTERKRTLELSSAALAVLRRQVVGKKADEPLFGITYDMVDSRFRPAKQAAGLDWLRFKDLRHVFGTSWVATGGTIRGVGGVLGHKKQSTSLRYTSSQAQEARARMDAVAAHLGLDRDHLRVEKGRQG